MELIYHRHKEAMKIVSVIIIKIQAFHDRNHTRRIASKFHAVYSTKLDIHIISLFHCFIVNKMEQLFTNTVILFSHSSSNNDNWNGFDNGFETSAASYQGSAPENVNNSGKRHHKSEKSEKTEKSDFNVLDVKASKPKSTNKTKSIEDDAWNLLNN